MESITKKQIVDALLNVSMAHAPHEVFFDFVASAAYSFANLMEYDENRKRTREESYLAIQKKYKPEESAKFGDILGMMILYAEQQDGIQDILGPIYEGLGLSSKQTGQFFTPQHVADLMARLAMDADVETSIKDRGFVKVYEPTCGAGAVETRVQSATGHVCRCGGHRPELRIYDVLAFDNIRHTGSSPAPGHAGPYDMGSLGNAGVPPGIVGMEG